MNNWNPFKGYPREVGFPHRRGIVYSASELIQKLNLYNRKADVYTSLYSFDQLNERKNRGIYSTARINKIYFDIDKPKNLTPITAFHKYCLTNNLLHTVFWSGGGFHIYIATTGSLKNKKGAVTNSQVKICSDLNLTIGINGDFNVDSHVIGNLAQLVRVPFSWNPKRLSYCIPLREEDLTSLGDIRRKASRPVGRIKVYGKEYLDLTEFDSEPITKNYDDIELNLPMEQIGIKNIDISKFPSCIRVALGKRFISHRVRYLCIVYLKELGIPMEDTIALLKEHLDWKVFVHCIREEKQVFWVYKRGDLCFPSCGTLALEGFCVDKDCGGANLY